MAMAKNRVRWPASWIYPELRRFPTAEAREKAAQAVALRGRATVAIAIRFLLGFALLLAFGYAIARLLTSISIARLVAMPITMLLCSAALLVVFVWAMWPERKRLRRFFREELCKCGLPTCLGCGYNLTGNTSGVCPECGTEIETDERD